MKMRKFKNNVVANLEYMYTYT